MNNRVWYSYQTNIERIKQEWKTILKERIVPTATAATAAARGGGGNIIIFHMF